MNELSFLDTAKEWVVTKAPDFAVDIAVFLLILLVGKIVISGIIRVLRTTLSKSERVSEMLRKFALNVTSKVLWVIVLMVALPRLGVDVAPLIAGLGVSGFILGFAFQESLANLAAGIMIMLNQPFKVGDLIEGGGTMGVVRSLTLMATEMTTGDNKKVTVPNKAMWGATITNYTALDTRRVDMKFGIAYDADMGKASQILKEILDSNELVLAEPAPVIEVSELADSSVNFVVRPWSKTADYWTVFFATHRTVKEKFDAAGIEIPFPQVTVHQAAA